MTELEILIQRRQARAEKQRVDESLIQLHEKAVQALLDPAEGKQVREQALQRIEKWDRERLCNPRYVKAWRDILNLPLAAIKQAILSENSEAISLRQNSPFGFLIGNSHGS